MSREKLITRREDERSAIMHHQRHPIETATNPPFRVPWLVAQRDLHRYLGRALDACERGHVLLFWHRYSNRGQKRCVLLSLAPFSSWQQRLIAAIASYRDGRFRRVILANLPRTQRRIRE